MLTKAWTLPHCDRNFPTVFELKIKASLGKELPLHCVLEEGGLNGEGKFLHRICPTTSEEEPAFHSSSQQWGPSVLREMFRVLSIKIQMADKVNLYLYMGSHLPLWFAVKLTAMILYSYRLFNK